MKIGNQYKDQMTMVLYFESSYDRGNQKLDDRIINCIKAKIAKDLQQYG